MFRPKYPRVHAGVQRAVRKAIAAKPYGGQHGHRVTVLNTLAAEVAAAYRLPAPRVTIEPHASDVPALGKFDTRCNTIVLPKTSVTGTLVQVARLRGMNDAKAKAWAASALFLAVPKTFDKMVRTRNIKFVKVRELA